MFARMLFPEPKQCDRLGPFHAPAQSGEAATSGQLRRRHPMCLCLRQCRTGCGKQQEKTQTGMVPHPRNCRMFEGQVCIALHDDHPAHTRPEATGVTPMCSNGSARKAAGGELWSGFSASGSDFLLANEKYIASGSLVYRAGRNSMRLKRCPTEMIVQDLRSTMICVHPSGLRLQ